MENGKFGVVDFEEMAMGYEEMGLNHEAMSYTY